MRALALIGAVALFVLVGCLGPKLHLPPSEPKGAHEWLCRNEVCPDEAMRIGGTIEYVGYNRADVLCNCDLLDARGVAVWVQAPPHPKRKP